MEYKIVYFLNHLWAGTWVDKFTVGISNIYLIGGIFLGLSLLALIFNKKNGRWIFLGGLIIAAIYFIINDQVIKYGILPHIFTRERPYIMFPNDIIASGEPWHDSSFFSGHMAFICAFITFLLYYYRKLIYWILGIIYIILIAFARMHNGMHYPTDIIAGSAFGIGYGLIAIFIINNIIKKYPRTITH